MTKLINFLYQNKEVISDLGLITSPTTTTTVDSLGFEACRTICILTSSQVMTLLLVVTIVLEESLVMIRDLER